MCNVNSIVHAVAFWCECRGEVNQKMVAVAGLRENLRRPQLFWHRQRRAGRGWGRGRWRRRGRRIWRRVVRPGFLRRVRRRGRRRRFFWRRGWRVLPRPRRGRRRWLGAGAGRWRFLFRIGGGLWRRRWRRGGRGDGDEPCFGGVHHWAFYGWIWTLALCRSPPYRCESSRACTGVLSGAMGTACQGDVPFCSGRGVEVELLCMGKRLPIYGGTLSEEAVCGLGIL